MHIKIEISLKYKDIHTPFSYIQNIFYYLELTENIYVYDTSSALCRK